MPVILLISLALLFGPGCARAAQVALKEKQIKHPDGSLKERYTYFVDGQRGEVREGLDEEFYPNGSKRGEIPWRDGKENGSVVYYFSDGRKSYEANYRDGKKNGFATVWYPSGQKQWQTVFREGLTNGVWREWYADGKKKFEANYSDGKLDGLATWWHDNGRMWQERRYQEGQLVKGSVREWDKAGRLTFPPADAGGNGEAPASGGTANEESRDGLDTAAAGAAPAGK